MEPLGPLGLIAYRVEDLSRARTFHRDNLAFREFHASSALACCEGGGTRLLLCQTGERDEAYLLYFRRGDIAARHRTLMAGGVTFLQNHHVHPDGSQEWTVFLEDHERQPRALHTIAAGATGF